MIYDILKRSYIYYHFVSQGLVFSSLVTPLFYMYDNLMQIANIYRKGIFFVRNYLRLLFYAMILFAFILAGCSKEDETEPAEAETEEEEPEEEPDEEEEPEEEEEEEEEEVTVEPSGGDIDFASVISELEDITDGTTELIYENNEPYVHDEEDVVISLDGYQLLELNDFHTTFAIPFNDQTDGAIV